MYKNTTIIILYHDVVCHHIFITLIYMYIHANSMQTPMLKYKPAFSLAKYLVVYFMHLCTLGVYGS